MEEEGDICKLCRRQYKFKPIYKRDAPSILPLSEMAAGLLRMFLKNTTTMSRYLLVIVCWLFVVPIGTSCIWNFFFQRTIETSTSQLFVHLALGSILFAIIIIGSLGTMSLVEYIRSMKLMETLNGEIRQDLNNNNGGDGNRRVDERNQAGDVLGFGDALFGLLDPQIDDENQQGEEEHEVEFEELIGLKGSLAAFFWHVFSVIAINGLILGLLFLIPFFVGRVIRKFAGLEMDKWIEESEWNQDVITTFIGYTTNAILAILYIQLLSFQSQYRTLSTIEKQIAAVLLFTYTSFKVVFFSLCELILFPIFTGVLCDYCTLDLFGSTIEDRITFCTNSPILEVLIHWLVGFIFMFNFGTFVRYVRSQVRVGLLWFLRDPDSPDFSPLREMIKESLFYHQRRFFLSSILYMSLVVLLVYLPVQVTQLLFTNMLPLNTFTEPLFEASFDLFLLNVLFPFSLQFFRPKRYVTKFLKTWLTIVGEKLSLTDYLFGNRITNNDQQDGQPLNNQQQGVVHNEGVQPVGDAEDGQDVREENGVVVRNNEVVGNGEVGRNRNERIDNEENNQPEIFKPKYFGLRIFILLALAWLTSLIFIVLLLSLPITLGRAFLSGLEISDIYAFVVGFYILWGICHCLAITYEWSKGYLQYYFIHQDNPSGIWSQVQAWYRIVLPQVFKFSLLIAKLSLLAVLWLGLMPVLVGLWITLTIIVPVRVDLNQTPTFYPYVTYAMGLLYLKIWYRMVTMEGVNNKWKTRFDQVHQNGIQNIDLPFILKSIIFPGVDFFLFRLCVPYFFNKTILPTMEFPPLLENYLSQYSYLLFSLFLLFLGSFSSATSYLVDLHHKIRDDRYLIGEQLQNISDSELLTYSDLPEEGEVVREEVREEVVGDGLEREEEHGEGTLVQ